MQLFPKKIRFDQRLFLYFFFIFFAFAGIVTLFQYEREKKFRTEQLEKQLSDYNIIIHNYLQTDAASFSNLQQLIPLFPDSLTRVTIIAKNGVVLFESFVSQEDTLENHLNRPEIIESIKSKRGSDVRNSVSTGLDYYYVANNYPNYFVRSALPYDITLIQMLSANPFFLYFMLFMFALTVGSLINMSNRIGKSIAQLRDFAQHAEKELPLQKKQKFTNDELGEISAFIVDIYNRLRAAKNDLFNERDKLYQHLQIAQEGLAIFSPDKKEILSNKQFLPFFDVISDSPLSGSSEVFAIAEMKTIKSFIDYNLYADNASINLQQEHIKINKNGYSFVVRCIFFQDRNFEITINDITRQEKENLLKRQLTQNISHELKTPVSSIQGYMETILANPDLDVDKLRFFIDRSHQQAIRLGQLLQDISLLNKIEEADKLFEREKVYVNEIVTDVLKDVSLELTKREVQIQNKFDGIIMLNGNRSLVYSIFRNLVDNSLLYAGENFCIGIQCYREDDTYFYFSFYDSGVGVSEDHLPRLFDRFYRVDHGRSRKMGGTGLGLAIVKNAVLFHHGKITARNRAEGGLEFLFSLKK